MTGFNEKLTTAKQAWARAGRLLTGKPDPGKELRLPPGQRLVNNWPVLDLGVQPHVETTGWRLDVDGLVENPISLDWAAFMALPQIEDVSDIHCVTQWSRYDNRWQGVATAVLIDLVKPTPDAAHVILHSHDGYFTNVELGHFAEEDCLIAHSHDGAPLTREHGGPARLVIPRYYFWKSAKWIKRIEFLAVDKPGFWEVRGYHNIGDPWLEERYG
ncbi:MAG: sulfite oxidase-like oxidoreductase [Sandarakinorhabdus sp.]|nr:sulfite oxidase-like oxidoreductase [Sandarakinorhabdus sp.]MBS3962489.1 sulfite oxidase-like oxidoreductase [Sandarakinorhabdus sp.]